jgi:hypothetical protein
VRAAWHPRTPQRQGAGLSAAGFARGRAGFDFNQDVSAERGC